jgi:hypothetical protein
MKIKCLYIILVCNIFCNIAYTQLGINSANSEPNSKAMLDVESTTKGMLIPRLTTGQRNAISSPPAGLMIYNATDNKFNYFNGANWSEFVVGGFTLPFFASTNVPSGAFELVNNSTNSASFAIRTYALNGKGVAGYSEYNIGVEGGSYTGIGVYGHADNEFSSNVLIGVKGQADNINGVGVQAIGATGLEVQGAVKVSSTNKFVFIHTATVSNKISPNGTDITNSMCNGDPNALLIVSQKINYTGTVYNNSPIGTYYNYDRAKWEIRNQNGTAIPINAQFTVMVIKQ